MNAIERHRQERLGSTVGERMTAEWFPEQAAFYNSQSRLVAAVCGRRAGKTRGLAAHFVRKAATQPAERLLYINTTLDECRKLFWTGIKRDGVYELVQRYNIHHEADRTRLTLHFPDTDSWIFLRGAKDENELAKALGDAYTEVAWDEAQKIRPPMAPTIREVLMPTLLDNGGRLRYTGSANRQQSGIFWDITQPDTRKRSQSFEVHHWNLLSNPHFGRAVWQDGQWFVYALNRKEPVSGPHPRERIDAEVAAARMKYGIEQLAADLDVPVDSPIVQREGYGLWTPEDSSYVYAIRKSRDPYYAPVRMRADGFPDVMACVMDLPGDWREFTFSLGGDLGFRDAFALHCWAWRLDGDPNLYEVFSWKKTELDSDQQFNAIKEVRAVLPLGQVVVDAGGIGLSVSSAWSKVFVERYGLPIVPAEKHEKESFQAVYNTDIAAGRIKFREGSETVEEMLQLQWSKLVTGSGKQIEDPTQDNHACFVAGTMVETDRGPRAIESICSGDMVWTRKGLRRVTKSWCSGVCPTWRMETESGRSIVATANHPICTPDGWIRLDGLIPGCMLTEWASTGEPRPSSIEGTTIDGIQSVESDRPLCIFSEPSTGDRSSCIGRFGKMPMVPFPSVSMSITSTKTPATTRSTISNAFADPSISAITCAIPSGSRNLLGLSSSAPSQHPRRGIAPPKDELGTPSMDEKLWRIGHCMTANASSAVERFEARTQQPRCAATSASPSDVVIPASTTSTSPASSAETCSGVTVTQSPSVALGRVRLVGPTGNKACVYNLSVEDEHEYFANGVLVHNCDASLYAHRASYAYRSRPEDRPPIPGTKAYYQRQAEELEEVVDEYDPNDWRNRGIA